MTITAKDPTTRITGDDPITLSNASQSLLGIPVTPYTAVAQREADPQPTVRNAGRQQNAQSVLDASQDTGRDTTFTTMLRNVGVMLGVPNAANLIIERMRTFKERTGVCALDAIQPTTIDVTGTYVGEGDVKTIPSTGGVHVDDTPDQTRQAATDDTFDGPRQ